MKKYSPFLLILAVGFLSLTLAASNVMAQQCEHLHQLSKKLHSQKVSITGCTLCVCEKQETYVIDHTIQASILADCDCDETNDIQCDKYHQHPNSGDGDWEGHACVWSPFDDPSLPLPSPESAGYQSPGIRNDCIFEADITRWIKYCKDNEASASEAYPRAGYHKGRWWIWCSRGRSNWIARGRMHGCDGVDPSYERSYDSAVYAAHPLPGNVFCEGPGPDFCDGSTCYIAGWQVGCITGKTNDRFYRDHCPPVGTYGVTEVGNISECPGGNSFVINDYRGKQICITPEESWKVRACYSARHCIDEQSSPCGQFGHPWAARLEGVIAIKGCGS